MATDNMTNEYLTMGQCAELAEIAAGAVRSENYTTAGADGWAAILSTMIRNMATIHRYETTDYGPTLRVFAHWAPISETADRLAEIHYLPYRPLALSLHS